MKKIIFLLFNNYLNLNDRKKNRVVVQRSQFVSFVFFFYFYFVVLFFFIIVVAKIGLKFPIFFLTRIVKKKRKKERPKKQKTKRKRKRKISFFF